MHLRLTSFSLWLRAPRRAGASSRRTVRSAGASCLITIPIGLVWERCKRLPSCSTAHPKGAARCPGVEPSASFLSHTAASLCSGSWRACCTRPLPFSPDQRPHPPVPSRSSSKPGHQAHRHTEAFLLRCWHEKHIGNACGSVRSWLTPFGAAVQRLRLCGGNTPRDFVFK